MKKSERTETIRHAAPVRASRKEYVLSLYITGITARSTRAIENITRICEEYLKGRCSLEVIDIYRHPHVGKGEQIIATPTLVKTHPLPLRRFIGDLSDTERILIGFDIQPDRRSESKAKNVS